MRIIITSLMILCLVSCGPEVYYENTYEVEELGWSYSDTLKFTPQITDIDRLNEIHLTIEHSPEYGYQNIYLKILTHFPDSETKEERLSIDLADGKGVWYGKCNSQACTLKIYLLEKFKFPSEGDYIFEIVQETRKENLDGIRSLKFEIVEAKA